MKKTFTDRFKTAVAAFSADAFYDPISGRGGINDRTERMVGVRRYKTPYDRMKKYQSSGFIQNIVEQPAEDSTREFIDVTTNRDDDLKINRLIENRLKELKVREKLRDVVRFSRMYEKGCMMFYGVDEGVAQSDAMLTRPMDLTKLNKINYINVIEEPDRFYFFILNRYDPTKADYNKVSFYIMGREVHESRIGWVVNNWYPLELLGVSIQETVNDSVNALDSALWSADSLIGDIATTIFQSDLIATMSADQRMEMLTMFKQMKNTQSVIGLKPGESYTKTTYTLNGIKEVFDFIISCTASVARMPRKILFGEAQGIVGAGEYDALNYYSQIAKFQELTLRPIIKNIIDMVVAEKSGEIYKALGGGIEGLDVEFKFKSLYKLAPDTEADLQLKNSQRDEIDIRSGKISPDEARTLDPRMDELEDFDSGAVRNESIKKFGAPVESMKVGEVTTPADPTKPGADMTAKVEMEKGEPDIKSNFGFRNVPRGEAEKQI